MAPQRRETRLTEDHLHWEYKKRSAQLRVLRVTVLPERDAGAALQSVAVAYVSFMADGRVRYSFDTYSRGDLGGYFAKIVLVDRSWAEQQKVVPEIEEAFRAELAGYMLTGMPPNVVAQGAGLRFGNRLKWGWCKRCPPTVQARQRARGLTTARTRKLTDEELRL